MSGVLWKRFSEVGAIKAKAVIIAAGGFRDEPGDGGQVHPEAGREAVRARQHLRRRPGHPAGGLGRRRHPAHGSGLHHGAAVPAVDPAHRDHRQQARQAVRRRRLLPFPDRGFHHGSARQRGVPDRRRGAPGTSCDATGPADRRLGNGRRNGSRAWHPGGQPGRDAGPLQHHAALGEDPDFHKQPEFLAAQDKGPWGAFDMSLGKAMYAGFTLGGLATSVDGQVLREDDTVVPGLYAVGACASNIAQDGKGYASGTQLGEGSFFGRRAGAHAAEARPAPAPLPPGPAAIGLRRAISACARGAVRPSAGG